MEPASVSAEESTDPPVNHDQLEVTSRKKSQTSSRRITSGFLLQPLRKSSNKRKSGPSEALGTSNQENVEPNFDTGTLNNGLETPPPPAVTETIDVPVVKTPESSLHVFKRRKGKQKQHHDRNTPSPRASQASSTIQSSSTSAPPPSSIPDDRSNDEQTPRSSHSASIDPAQIVRLALSLNENRRLNLSPGRLPSPSPGTAPPRTTSAAVGSRPTPSPVIQGDHRENLRRSLGPRPTSSTGSPSRLRVDGQSVSHDEPMPNADAGEDTPEFTQQLEPDVPTVFSAATLSRAEKARKFIELHAEYRRLLQVLPPLRPASTLPQNQNHLGRKYNPLQSIRNRRVRGHVQDLLDPEGAGWNDIDKVKEWVDTIEAKAKSSHFHQGDIAMLPVWNNTDLDVSGEPDPETSFSQAPSGHAQVSKSKRPKLDWAFSPAGLLADAYWLEKDSNKELIETRTGMKLFPTLEIPRVLRDNVSARSSYESERVIASGVHDSPDSNVVNSIPFHGDGTQDAQHGSSHVNTTPSQNSKSMGIVKRHLLGRRKKISNARDELDDSDDESIGGREKVSLGRRLGVNIGPLERHMSAILKTEGSATADNFSPLQPSSTFHDDGQQRRGGVSSETQGQKGNLDPDSPENVDGGKDSRDLRNSFGSDGLSTPRISNDNIGRDPQANGHLSEKGPSSKQSKSRARGLSFFHRHSKARQMNKVEETDFATNPKTSEQEAPEVASSPGSSIRTGSRSNSVTRFSSPLHSRGHSSVKEQEITSLKNKDSTSNGPQSHFFKAGRIGELVRSELGHALEGGSKKSGHRKDSEPSSSMSESEDATDNLPYLTVTSSSDKRSRSTSDLEKSRSYDSRNLPTFRSAHAPPATKEQGSTTGTSDDHISRQMQEQKERYSNSRSRFGRLTPLSINTTPDVSPNTSNTNLPGSQSKYESAQTARSEASNSPRNSAGVQDANSRLSKVLREPGGVGRGGLPVTGLSSVDPTSPEDSGRQRSEKFRRVSEEYEFQEEKIVNRPVTAKDVQRVRALLLSSGVKAQAIVRRTNAVKDPSSKFLLDAAATANVSVAPQLLREEHVVAARILSNNLEKGASLFEKLASTFRNETCQGLHARLDDLRERGNSDLMISMQTAGDDTEAVIARLTTTHTLAVKQVNDSVDRMIRARWRRLRWLSRAGFKLLEWLLVGIMWFIWAFVFAINIVQGTFRGVGRAVKWLFWL